MILKKWVYLVLGILVTAISSFSNSSSNNNIRTLMILK